MELLLPTAPLARLPDLRALHCTARSLGKKPRHQEAVCQGSAQHLPGTLLLFPANLP